LHHAHAAFSRFMAAHPLISRFIAEHPTASRFILQLAHHIPILDHHVPIAPHITAEFMHCAKRRPKPPKIRI